ncbi:DNA helicase UvrD, partial [Paenibacillus sp. 28ISP30-2]|nr:DNA helicase UvrD [Paenibacillus sp. 28ISP30-2]
TRRTSFGQPKGAPGHGSRANSGTNASGTATRVSSRPGPGSGPARTASSVASTREEPRISVPVWKCTDDACKAWMRRDTTGARRTASAGAGTPPVCPLCSSPMTEGTRSIPAR